MEQKTASKKTVNNFDSLITSVENFISSLRFDKIYVGFSGGADSTALLVILNEISKKTKLDFTAVHFEHGLRGKSSLMDAEWCKNFCSKNNIKLIEKSLNVKENLKSEKNIEAAARKLRFEAWKKIITKPEKEVIALGHHKGDKIENLFLRLLRGSNSSSLTSLRKINNIYGLTLIRPLLDCSKKTLENFLHSRNIDNWRKDETNDDSDYRRNFFRNKILPKLYRKIPNAEAGLNNAIEALSYDADFIEECSREAYAKDFNSESCNIEKLLNLHPAVRIRVLRYWINKNLKLDYIPDKNFLERINSELNRNSKHKKLIPIYQDHFLVIAKGFLSYYKKSTEHAAITWNWKKHPEIDFLGYRFKLETLDSNITDLKKKSGVFFDANQFPDKLILKQWEKGDKFIPFGHTKDIKLKKIFADRKISSEDKMSIPLVCLPDNSVIWVAGIRRSSFAPVTETTNKIAHLSFVK